MALPGISKNIIVLSCSHGIAFACGIIIYYIYNKNTSKPNFPFKLSSFCIDYLEVIWL